MKSRSRKLGTHQVIICFIFIAFFSQIARAEAITSDDIVRALLPPDPTTRSLRGVSVELDEEEEPPQIDLQVNFAFDSAELTNEALITLKALGQALQDERLKSFNFLILGHTDAKGSDAYNMALSDRRALAVRNHLSFFYDVAEERIASMGMGKTQLALPHDPENDLNRRVEIRNVSN